VSTATASGFLNAGTAGGWSAWPERLPATCSTGTTPTLGGHFAAFEQPGLFVTELRNCFRALR